MGSIGCREISKTLIHYVFIMNGRCVYLYSVPISLIFVFGSFSSVSTHGQGVIPVSNKCLVEHRY